MHRYSWIVSVARRWCLVTGSCHAPFGVWRQGTSINHMRVQCLLQGETPSLFRMHFGRTAKCTLLSVGLLQHMVRTYCATSVLQCLSSKVRFQRLLKCTALALGSLSLSRSLSLSLSLSLSFSLRQQIWGNGRECACIFRGLVNARGLLLFPKKDRLCKGRKATCRTRQSHMQIGSPPKCTWLCFFLVVNAQVCCSVEPVFLASAIYRQTMKHRGKVCAFLECPNAWAFPLIFQKVLALQSWAYRVFLLSGVPVAGRGRWNLDRFGAGFADVYKGQLYGLGDGEGGECRMHFQRPLKCTGFASLSKKDRLCKGHMQDMPIPHAFWQPA